MVNVITSTLVTFFHFLLRVFKRAFCCFKRRRGMFNESVTLTNIGIVPTIGKETESKTWESWESPLTVVTSTKPVDPVSQKIELYRQQRVAASQENFNEEPKIDYFQDMTPRIIKQTKMLLHSEESEGSLKTTNFSFAPDPVFNSSELGVWEDSQTWEDQTEQDWDPNIMIREKKKMERERRLAEQQQKRFDRESRIGKSLSAIKLS